MRKTIIIQLAALASCAAWAEAGNTLYFTDAIVLPGETACIELCMTSAATDLTCLEAEIQLPQGLSVVCNDDGSPQMRLHPGRAAKHELLANVLSSGNLKLLVSSIDGDVIGSGDGALLSFMVEAAPTAITGEYQIETVGETLLVNTQAEACYQTGVTGSVLITDDATAIDVINDEKLKIKNGDAVYDLSGRKMADGKWVDGKLPKGIFIKSGRKELHK